MVWIYQLGRFTEWKKCGALVDKEGNVIGTESR